MYVLMKNNACANIPQVTMEQIALAGGREAALGLDDEVRKSLLF